MKTDTEIINSKDILQPKQDMELINNYLFYEGELTDWAKKELAKAKLIPESEYIFHDDFEILIL